MSFYADLHVHSRFSRATSRDCNLEQLAYWARRKGIAVIGTGDFTHPAWLNEIKEKLLPAEPGLFRLRDDLEKDVQQRLAPACKGPARFMLEVEISTIYKKGDCTRKVHHIIYVPDLEKAEHMIQRLSSIGNLASDGRPILGLDSRDLLEITLESGEGSYLVPAHIWTPWFSVLGSKSGFDSIDECYGDLSPHIFAIETGLSSDPPMNWRLSGLDRYQLVSNSDAHSPPKLGREACVFDTEMDYFAMRKALETGKGYGGTVEFFPEEGKYHLDGHRKCGIRFSPEETRKNGGLCPVCGKTVTVGVMSRVHELADRPEGTRPEGAVPFRSLIPLPEVLSQILGVGANTKKVWKSYQSLVSRLGPELFILEHAPIEDIRRICSSIFAEAIARMREGRVIREAGFDGEYGIIRLFRKDELEAEKSAGFLFDMPQMDVQRRSTERRERGEKNLNHGGTEARSRKKQEEVALICGERIPAANFRNDFHAGGEKSGEKIGYPTLNPAMRGKRPIYPALAGRPTLKESRGAYPEPAGILESLDPDQRSAAEITEGPLLVTAGPGTGKTRTLTHRIAHLVADRGVPPEQCLAITFTRRAAGEMVERLQRLLPGQAAGIPVMTFHALGYTILRENADRLGLSASGGFRVAGDMERIRVLMESLSVSERKAGQLLTEISRLKRKGAKPMPGDDVAHALNVYQHEMRRRSLVDFDDLIALPVELLDTHPDLASHYRERYHWISVDEYQDIDEHQYRLIKLLVPSDGHLCVIGDPNQAIYGFRGTDVRFFQQFAEDFPNARTVQLTRNYRSGRTIVDASMQVIAASTLVEERALQALMQDTTRIVIRESFTDKAEAEFVVHTVERLIGGSTFFSMDSGRVESGEGEAFSFSDFAVLYRTNAQAEALCEAFSRSGMPFQQRSHIGLCDTPVMQSMIEAMRDMPEEDALLDRLDQAVAGLEAGNIQQEALLVARALRPLAERSGDLEGFLSELAMGVDVDLWDPRADCVSLLTLHAAKGLEFPVVFIVGCEDGILPLRLGASRDIDIDEERRLFFVGMTRARSRLFLCHARKRQWMGKLREMTTSPFILDIEKQLIEQSKSQARRKKARHTHEQLDLF